MKKNNFNKRKSKSKKGNYEDEFKNKLLIKGRHEVSQALEAKQKIELIYMSEQVSGEFPEKIKQLADNLNIKIKVLKSDVFKNKFGYNTQGITAVSAPFEYCPLDKLIKISENRSGIIVALNKVEDPGNLGAIVRTVEASGCDGVIIPKHRSASMTEGAIRTAQGASSYLPVSMVTNLSDAIEKLKSNGFWAIGLDEDANKNHTEIMYNEKIVLVAGGEDAGLGSRLAKSCDDIVSIPLNGKTSSLNVSVSVAIGVYEILRQKKFLKKV